LLAGVPDLDLTRIEESMRLIRESDVAYEFRTTVVPQLLQESDIARIAQWIEGSSSYVLQQFRAGETLDPALQRMTPYSTMALQRMAESASQWVESVIIRGI